MEACCGILIAVWWTEMDGCLKQTSVWTESMKVVWWPSLGKHSESQESQIFFPILYWGWEKAGLFILAVWEVLPC